MLYLYLFQFLFKLKTEPLFESLYVEAKEFEHKLNKTRAKTFANIK